MQRIPPIHCLQTFEALARLKSMKAAASELCVTPSAISHRMRLMELVLQKKMFDDNNFSLTAEGEKYLLIVLETLNLLEVSFEQ